MEKESVLTTARHPWVYVGWALMLAYAVKIEFRNRRKTQRTIGNYIERDSGNQYVQGNRRASILKEKARGAALAFYTIFSLAPLLLIVIAIAGFVFGQEAAQGQIIGQIQGLVGENSAKSIQSMIEEARKPAVGLIATVAVIIMLLLGATAVFAQLQESLNIIWKVEEKPGEGIWKMIKNRFISLLAVPGTGFLLFISLVISAGNICDWYDPRTCSSIPRISIADN